MAWIEDQSGELINLDFVKKIYLYSGLFRDSLSGEFHGSLHIIAITSTEERLCLFHSKEGDVFDVNSVVKKYETIRLKLT